MARRGTLLSERGIPCPLTSQFRQVWLANSFLRSLCLLPVKRRVQFETMIAKSIARMTTCRARKSRERTSRAVITRPVAMSVPSPNRAVWAPPFLATEGGQARRLLMKHRNILMVTSGLRSRPQPERHAGVFDICSDVPPRLYRAIRPRRSVSV